MSPLSESGEESARHERAMSSLSDRTGTPLPRVRQLFEQELGRLAPGAKIRSYLTILTASNVGAMLRRENL